MRTKSIWRKVDQATESLCKKLSKGVTTLTHFSKIAKGIICVLYSVLPSFYVDSKDIVLDSWAGIDDSLDEGFVGMIDEVNLDQFDHPINGENRETHS